MKWSLWWAPVTDEDKVLGEACHKGVREEEVKEQSQDAGRSAVALGITAEYGSVIMWGVAVIAGLCFSGSEGSLGAVPGGAVEGIV